MALAPHKTAKLELRCASISPWPVATAELQGGAGSHSRLRLLQVRAGVKHQRTSHDFEAGWRASEEGSAFGQHHLVRLLSLGLRLETRPGTWEGNGGPCGRSDLILLKLVFR